jgi:hypothetical protein
MKLSVQTKRPIYFVYYDFHFKIFDNKEDVMFTTELDMFLIGTIVIPIHIEHVSTTNYTK